MPDTSDLFNPPRPQFHLLRHPLLLLALVLILFGAGYVIHRLIRPAPTTAPTPLKPNGDWIGEITMDGRYWMPTIHGDTPGPHRHAVFHFHLQTTDSFLDNHAGDGSMRIVGESITRPFRAYDWKIDLDGSLQFGFLSTPTLFNNEFQCEVDGSNVKCKAGGPLKAVLTLHPGTPAEANLLLQQVTQRAAAEPPLTPFPKTHEITLCSDDYETETLSVADDDPKYKVKPGRKQKPPPPCNRFSDD